MPHFFMQDEGAYKYTPSKQIAEYIRTVLKMEVHENNGCFLPRNNKNSYSACAIGMEVIRKLGSENGYQTFIEKVYENTQKEVKAISEILEIKLEEAE